MEGWEVDRLGLRRLGEVIMVILLLSLGAPAAATAAGGGNVSSPQPQKAPNPSPTPAPDPAAAAPQAQTPTSSSQTPVATSHPVGDGIAVTPGSTRPSRSSPRVTAPTGSSVPEVRVPHLPVARPAARPMQTVAPAAKQPAAPLRPAPHREPRRSAPHRSDPRRAAVTHKASRSDAPFGVTLVSPNDLPRLSALALAEARGGHPGGALLLFSALALGVLVIASLTLLRRLTRLRREWMETTTQ
jgi:hypothetical protein